MTTASTTYLTQIHKLLEQYFDLEEIRTLCFDLNVDFDDVRGEGKSARIRELLLDLGRNGRLPQLIALVQKERPGHLCQTIFNCLAHWLLRVRL